MAYVLSDNILSPLGATSADNYQAVKAGRSGLREHEAKELRVPQDYVAALFSDTEAAAYAEEGLSRFEALALASCRKALAATEADVSGEDTVFILSSTKGSVEQMQRHDDPYPLLGDSARKIADKLGIRTQPIVVCNACISGTSALVLADRLLHSGRYRYAVVCGADSPSRFVISGFQSLKALSTEPCRPFDMERFGLNLGEAAATLVLGREPQGANCWQIGHGAVRNDAYHTTAPSKTGEGLYRALTRTLQGVDIKQLALINAHGTATLFNDQMESVAIGRAALSTVPVNALKGYFGHTLGAAGVLETVLTMQALDDHCLPATRGFAELGVSGKVNIVGKNASTDGHTFIKLISGFGGCNATLLGTLEPLEPPVYNKVELHTTHQLLLTPETVTVDGRALALPPAEDGKDLLTRLYKEHVGNYPKYYKMDALSRLGFVASELLLQAEGPADETPRSDRALLLFNRTSSVQADRKYLASIENPEECWPSPSVFVYTLPNIVAGEIAIRHHYQGETGFYILGEKDEAQMTAVIESAFQDPDTTSVLAGWIDYEADDRYEAQLALYERR